MTVVHLPDEVEEAEVTGADQGPQCAEEEVGGEEDLCRGHEAHPHAVVVVQGLAPSLETDAIALGHTAIRGRGFDLCAQLHGMEYICAEQFLLSKSHTICNLIICICRNQKTTLTTFPQQQCNILEHLSSSS